MLGNGRLEAMCFDGTKRLCHIRGKLRKKVGMSRAPSVAFSHHHTRTHRGNSVVWRRVSIFSGSRRQRVRGSQSAAWPRATHPCFVLFSSRSGLTRRTSSWSGWGIIRCVGRLHRLQIRPLILCQSLRGHREALTAWTTFPKLISVLSVEMLMFMLATNNRKLLTVVFTWRVLLTGLCRGA